MRKAGDEMNETKEKTPEGANSKNQLKYRRNIAKSQITKETREESYMQRPVARTQMILDCMGEQAMTSRQIAWKLGYGENMNAVRPRITELLEAGLLKVEGKALDKTTQRHVAVYKAV